MQDWLSGLAPLARVELGNGSAPTGIAGGRNLAPKVSLPSEFEWFVGLSPTEVLDAADKWLQTSDFLPDGLDRATVALRHPIRRDLNACPPGHD